MTNNLYNFIQPLIGGILIGLSSTIMLCLLGRITGISGILSSILSTPKKDHLWRYSFLVGLIFGGGVFYYFRPENFFYNFDFPVIKVILAGFLVGFGTNLSGGCTSGHGVCGIPRLSKRSISATLIFMLFGIITVFIFGRF